MTRTRCVTRKLSPALVQTCEATVDEAHGRTRLTIATLQSSHPVCELNSWRIEDESYSGRGLKHLLFRALLIYQFLSYF